jgi:hypothetical protein
MRNTIIATIAVLGFSLAVASPAHADTVCTNSLAGATGNVVVPDGATCLLGGTVIGDVSVGVGSTLRASATISGNLSADQCAEVAVNGGWIGGNATIRRCTGLDNNTPETIANAGVGGNVSCTDNGTSCDMTIDRIGGNVVIEHNGLSECALTQFALTTVEGNVRIDQNTSCTSLGASPVAIVDNVISGNLQCNGNRPGVTNEGRPNTVNGKETGQCRPGF